MVHQVSSKTRDSVCSMETMAYIVRKDGYHDHGGVAHTCELAKCFTHHLSELHRLGFIDGTLALVGDTSFPVASPCSPTPATPCCLPGHRWPSSPLWSLLGSFVFSVISLCLLSLSWMNLKRGLWPVVLCVKHCYLEHAGNTDMRLSLVILSSVERDRRKSSPCHPSEGHQ